MRNLEQIRAANALVVCSETEFKGANNGEVVKKVPAMIRQNGILGAAAFALENQRKTDHADVFKAIIKHLATPGINKIEQSCELKEFIEWLTQYPDASSERLREVTNEAMAYLSYLRRFANKKRKEKQ